MNPSKPRVHVHVGYGQEHQRLAVVSRKNPATARSSYTLHRGVSNVKRRWVGDKIMSTCLLLGERVASLLAQFSR